MDKGWRQRFFAAFAIPAALGEKEEDKNTYDAGPSGFAERKKNFEAFLEIRSDVSEIGGMDTGL